MKNKNCKSTKYFVPYNKPRITYGIDNNIHKSFEYEIFNFIIRMKDVLQLNFKIRNRLTVNAHNYLIKQQIKNIKSQIYETYVFYNV